MRTVCIINTRITMINEVVVEKKLSNIIIGVLNNCGLWGTKQKFFMMLKVDLPND